MTGVGSGAVASRQSSGDQSDDAAEVGIESVSHVKGVASLSHILGRKWTTTIMITLSASPLRHGPLSRKLSGISRKVLHQSLDALRDDGFVEKIIDLDDVGGSATYYGLTPLGHSLAAVFSQMDTWCEDHLDEMPDKADRSSAGIRVARSPSEQQ